jgi:hypothetical protein
MGTIATGLSLLSRVTDNTGHTVIERSQRALQRVQHAGLVVDDENRGLHSRGWQAVAEVNTVVRL